MAPTFANIHHGLRFCAARCTESWLPQVVTVPSSYRRRLTLDRGYDVSHSLCSTSDNAPAVQCPARPFGRHNGDRALAESTCLCCVTQVAVGSTPPRQPLTGCVGPMCPRCGVSKQCYSVPRNGVTHLPGLREVVCSSWRMASLLNGWIVFLERIEELMEQRECVRRALARWLHQVSTSCPPSPPEFALGCVSGFFEAGTCGDTPSARLSGWRLRCASGSSVEAAVPGTSGARSARFGRSDARGSPSPSSFGSTSTLAQTERVKCTESVWGAGQLGERCERGRNESAR